MYDELFLNEEEGVALGLPGRGDHVLHFLGRQLRQVVDHLQGVRSVRHAEAEFELEWFDALPSEIVSFNHKEVGNRLVADGEFNLKTDGSKAKEIRPKMIL